MKENLKLIHHSTVAKGTEIGGYLSNPDFYLNTTVRRQELEMCTGCPGSFKVPDWLFCLANWMFENPNVEDISD